MPLATFEQVSLAYGHVPLLDHVDLVVEPGSRIGLIGRNGAGKSSLLRLLAGSALPDDGRIWRQPGLRIGVVAQEPELDSKQSVFEATVAGLGELSRVLADYHSAAHQLQEEQADSANALERMQAAQELLERHDGWRVEHRVEAVLSRLGLAPDARIDTLSGGLRKRVALARALAGDPQLLILDEPTNHLDVDSREALIHALMNYNGAVILISHDRHLIEATADRLWLVRGGTVKPYDGDMASYRSLLLEERGARTSERKDDRGDSDAKATRTDQRRQAAERRAELAPLKKAMLTAEQRVEKLSKEIAALDVLLADPEIYATDPARAQNAAQQRGQVSKQLADAEESWLAATDAYEQASAD
jgi:ATP-binding cassette subfamily F protein 3